MGGFLILLALSTSTLLWADLGNPYVWIVLWMTVSFGLIGFLDDYRKLTRRSHHGMPGRVKLLLEIILAVAACIALAYIMPAPLANTIAIPFVKTALLNIGWFFLLFGALVIVGASNAVNLTDGLDGLAIGATPYSPITCSSTTSRAPTNWPCSSARWSARASVSCGSTRRPPASSWAIPGRCRSAPRSAPSAS
jgi:UDP-N-acetylmuramyl pentapeptide phosphotransferase/UDP-N-acetylglucosamine-1-phosphate transferase